MLRPGLLLLLLIAPLYPTLAKEPAPAAGSEPPPVVIGPQHERIETLYIRPGRRKVVRITPASGEPYCLEIHEPDPMDPFDPGYSARVRCP